MVKKIAAYSLILIADIALLAHAVIPHHHHQSVACIAEIHCHDDALVYNHDISVNGHQHDGNSDSTACILKQVVVPPSQGKLLKSCDFGTDTNNHDSYTVSNFGFNGLKPFSEVETYIPVFFPFVTSFVTNTLGLRAPPVV